jgi:dihydrosphingosine 1-phosphate phosphatase
MGIMLWWAKLAYGEYLDSFIASGTFWAPITVLAVTIFLIRVHPEPADACCKCFEDGVAFAGVFVGIKFGQWRSPVLHHASVSNTTPTPLFVIILKTMIKIVLGTKLFQP